MGPTDTFGNTGAALRGTPVPGGATATTQVPGTGTPPVLTAQFKQPALGTQKAPAVVTSGAATDHVGEMTTANNSALTDAQNLAVHNLAKAFGTAAADDGSKTDAGTKTDESSIDSLLSSMGVGGDSQQQGIADQDKAAIQADQQAQQEVDDALSSMEAGSFPLTPAEQAQVNAVKGQYTGALNSANEYAKNVTSGATALMAKTGMQMYSPQYAIGQIQSAIKLGQAKVEQVNNRIVASMSKLTTSLQDGDYKTATRLYTKIGDDIAARNKEIDSINKTVTDTQGTLLKANLDAQAAFDKTKSDILKSMAQGGATQAAITAASSAADLSTLFGAAGDFLKPTGQGGLLDAYALYSTQAKAQGKTPMDVLTFSQQYDKAPKAPSPGSVNLIDNPQTVPTPDTQNWIAAFGTAGGNIPSPYGKNAASAPLNAAYYNLIANNAMKVGITGPQMAAIFNSKQSAEKALTTVTKNQAMMTVAEQTASSNFDQIESQMATLPPKTISPLLNEFIQKGAIGLGNPNTKAFAALLMTSLNEYAKVITGQTSGAAVSDAARKEAQSMISAADTPDSIRNFISTAKQEMGNRSTGYESSKQMLYGIITDRFGDVNVPGLSDASPVDAALQNTPNEADAQTAVTKFYQSNKAAQPQIEQMITDGTPYSKIQEWLQSGTQ